jgi:hypothetical protein
MFNKILIVFILSLVFSQSFAQIEIKRYTINSGGSKIAGGSYEINSSIGLVDVNDKMSGDTYILTSGFWHENNDLIFKNGFE